MFPTLALLVLLHLLPPEPPSALGAQDRLSSSWANATDVDLVDDERRSLEGVTTVAVSVNLSNAVDETFTVESITSAVAFQLGQAGLHVTPTRAVDEPLLVVTVRVIDDETSVAPTRRRRVYRVFADLLQLVRLADRTPGRARLMMASTWHAGSFGIIDGSDLKALLPRVAEVVETFVADHRSTNPEPTAETEPTTR